MQLDIGIGRASENVLSLEDEYVSSRHAQLTFRDGKFHLFDLDSYNGIQVNGHRIEKSVVLHDADRIQIGKFTISTPMIPVLKDGPILTIEQLRVYLLVGLKADLERTADLGDNEATFQHAIASSLKARLGEPFRVVLERGIQRTTRKADIVINHAHECVAIEIKPRGVLEPLLKDAAKLKDYLRRKGSGVTFGVLVYRSPRPVQHALYKAVREVERLAIVRVHR